MQEALNNVAKHARARRAFVAIERPDGEVRLVVRDDGAGFDPASLVREGRPASWGMAIMRERAQALGGTLQVESAPGQGTALTVIMRGDELWR